MQPFDPGWMIFMASTSAANIFHHPQWAKLLQDCYGFRPFVIAIKDPDGHLVAGLPMMEIRNPLRRSRWASLPFSDHCDPIYTDAASLNQLSLHLQKLYLAEKLYRVEIRWTLPGQPLGYPSAGYAFHQIQLSSDFDAISKRIHPMHRRNARTAIHQGVNIVWGSQPEHLNAFYQLHLQTRRRQGAPIQPKRFFELLYSHLIAPGLGSIVLAYQGAQCLAGAVFLYWQSTFTYKYGASDIHYLSLRPNDLIFWSAIQWACEHGYKVFDMGRSDLDNPGLSRFKHGWGAEETMLHYTTLSARPPGQATGRLLKLVKPVIQKSPAWVCQAVGELLYQYSA